MIHEKRKINFKKVEFLEMGKGTKNRIEIDWIQKE